MKFNQKVRFLLKERWIKKVLLTMKLTWFLSLFLTLGASASLWSQTSKISVNVTNESLQDLLLQIEDNSQYRFFYNNNDIDVNQRVTVNMHDKTIGEILSTVFNEIPYSFKEMENNVILIERIKTVGDSKGNQQKNVSGKITDSSGAPLPGVTVLLKGTTNGTVSNIDGDYTLTNVPSGATLLFSFMGMKSQEIEVAGQSVINVAMQEESIGLDEVVAIGYGTTKKKDVTGAVINVNVKDFASAAAPATTTELLQGKVPGVTVMNDDSEGPNGDGPTVRIRGRSTLNSEGPLWIVDGLINENGVSPSEIESITVLKDASAAIYGTRASGGVILVTTKKGKKGLNVDFDVKYGWSTPWKKLEAMNAEEYCDYYTNIYEEAGQTVPTYLGMDYFRTTRTNWLDAVMRTGAREDYNVTISGGNDRSTFSLFGNWKVVNGTLHNTFNKSGRIRIKSEHQVHKRVTLGENISLSTSQGIGANTTSGYTGILISSIYYPASASVFLEDGSYGGVVDENNAEAYAQAGNFGDLLNPYATLDRKEVDNPNISALLSGYAIVDIWDGLKFRSNISYKTNHNYNRDFTYRILEVGKVYDYNKLEMTAYHETSMVAEQLLTYENTFGKHKVAALAGYTSEKNTYDKFSASARDFSTEDEYYQEFENASDYDTDTPSSERWENSLISMIGRLEYSYNNKYYLTGVVRRDGTSKLAKNNRWGVFPSLSAAWRISDESFMSDVTFIDDLKIRGSWGKMGNISPLGNYAYSANLTNDSGSIMGEVPTYISAYYMDDISNENLKWETTTTTDVGFEVYLLDSRLNVSFDYYYKKVTDMLNTVDLPDVSGISSDPWMNVGQVDNKGIEFVVGWEEHKGDFSYGASFNFAHNKNELIKYSDTDTYERVSSNVRADLYPMRHEEGHPLFSYYLIKTDGIFQSDTEAQAYTKDGEMIQPNAVAGDIKFVDYNDDGEIDSDDKQFCGDYYPDFTYGINLSFGYKNWDCSMFFQGVQNVDIFAGYKYSTYQAVQGYNLLKEANNYWSETNKGADIPAAKYIDSNNNYSTESDWYLEDGSYLRLKSMTIGYTVPHEILSKVGISNIRLYMSGQNLLTFTKYSGFDPEVGSNGLDMLTYPQSRTVMFGASLSF